MTKDDLKKELDELGVEYPDDAKKGELEELLEAASEEMVEELTEATEEVEEGAFEPYEHELVSLGKTITVVGEFVAPNGRLALKASDGCTYHADVEEEESTEEGENTE